MVYKQKLLLLSALTGILALIYAASLIFSPGRLNSRGVLHVWLEGGRRDEVRRIELSGGGGENVSLIRDDSLWYVEGPADSAGSRPGYPAKTARIEDLLRLLSARSPYPPRGNSPSSHGRLGLDEASASRILLRGASGTPILDLLVGRRDAVGREVYLRENGSGEVRSGEDRFSAYLGGSRTAWYNLRLLPERDGESPDLRMVQRVTVLAPPAPSNPEAADGPAAPERPPALVFTRSDNGWIQGGTAPDSLEGFRVDSYIRGILDAEGDDFLESPAAGDPVFNEGRISIEMGDGGNYVIQIGPVLETGDGSPEGSPRRRCAVVSGSPYVYALAEWTMNRIFRERSYFLKDEAAPDSGEN
jgi:hypothetical protein